MKFQFIITGDGAVLPHKVDIANCTRQPCPLVRGADAVVQIGFFARMFFLVV